MSPGPAPLKANPAFSAGEGVLNCFWDLASLDAATRDAAAAELISELKGQQAQFETSAPATEPLPPKPSVDQQISSTLQHCSPMMVYAVKRLCRGLSSSRKGARQGFSLALAALLQSMQCVSPAQIVAVLDLMLDPSASLKSGEARDLLLGRLFGYAAVVRACTKVDADLAMHIAACAAQLAASKSFMREAAVAVLLELSERVDDETLMRVLTGTDFHAWLAAPPEESLPETLLLVLKLWGRFPADLRAACPLLPAGCAEVTQRTGRKTRSSDDTAEHVEAAFFSDAHMAQMLPVLRSSTHCHPRLHSLWPALLSLLVPGFNGSDEGAEGPVKLSGHAEELQAFWVAAFEGDVFVSASHERKYLGFTLFNLLLPHLQAEHVPVVFTPNFLRTLSNNLSKKDSYLNGIARKCVGSISAFMEESDPDTRVAVALALQQHGGSIFDRLSKKLSSSVLDDMDASGLRAHLIQLQAKFSVADDEQADQDEVVMRQQWAVQQMAGILKQAGAGADLKLEVLRFLALSAFFATDPLAKQAKRRAAKGASAVTVSPAVRQICAARLIALADSLSKNSPQAEGGNRPSAGGEPATRQPQLPQPDLLIQVAAYVEELKAAGAAAAYEASPASERTFEVLASLRKRLVALTAELDDSADRSALRLRSLHQLVCLLELHTLGDPAAADADAMADLTSAVDAALCAGTTAADGDAPHWMDALLDILLSLLAQSHDPLPSVPLRDAAVRVFKSFCGELTPTGIQDLVRILMQPLEGGVGDEDEDEEEEEDADSDAEEEKEDQDSDAQDAVSSDGDSSDSDDATGEEDQGLPGQDVQDGATDEQMFRMDAQLAAYFSTLRDRRTLAKTNRQELINFKLRVLSLLEEFIKKNSTSSLLQTLPVPLLAALDAASKPSGDHSLAERLAGVIKNRLCKTKPELDQAEDGDQAAQLRRALYLASRSHDKRTSDVAAAVYIYLQGGAARSAGSAASLPEACKESACAGVADYFTKKKSRLNRMLFVELFRRVPGLATAVLPDLLQQTLSARTEYLQAEAFALCDVALKANQGAFADVAAANSDVLGKMILQAVTGSHGKVQRHVEALKVACRVAEQMLSKGGGPVALLGNGTVDALLAAAEAQTIGNPKMDGQLRRLVQLLQADSGGKRKLAQGEPAAAKKKKLKD